MAATHELCPEERSCLGNIAIGMANYFLEEMGKEVKGIIFDICDAQNVLADQVSYTYHHRSWDYFYPREILHIDVSFDQWLLCLSHTRDNNNRSTSVDFSSSRKFSEFTGVPDIHVCC